MLKKRLVDVSFLDRLITHVPEDVYDAQSYIRGVEDILSLIRSEKTENEWISVEKAMPKFEQDVLVTDGEAFSVGYWREDAQAWDSTEFGWIERQDCDMPCGLGKVTHWALIPEFKEEV